MQKGGENHGRNYKNSGGNIARRNPENADRAGVERQVINTETKQFYSCRYCGKIHDENYKCDKKPVEKKKIDDIVRFRNTPRWQKKRRHIKERDNYLCQICIRELYGTKRRFNHEELQVHHAVSINSNSELKLDDDNLLTLCPMHHSMCDRGEIPYDEVRKIISEQENRTAEQKARLNYR